MHTPFARTCIAMTLAAAGWGNAQAGNMYALGSIGSLSYTGDAQTEINTALTGVGNTPSQSSLGSQSTGFKAMVGYEINPNWAVEGGYVGMGTFKYSATTASGAVSANVTSYGYNFSVLAMAPVNDKFSLLGKVGYTMGNQTSTVTGNGASLSISDDQNSVSYGIGGMYKLTPTLSLRAEWEQLFNDVGMVSFGLQTSF